METKVVDYIEVFLPLYSCDSNCRTVANCSNGLKVLSCDGSIRRHGKIYGHKDMVQIKEEKRTKSQVFLTHFIQLQQ